MILEAPKAELSLADFPLGTELVEVPVEDGIALRGIYVPGRPGGPVTLHLMESMATIGVGAVPYGSMSIGFVSDASHSLVVDDYPPEPAGRWLRVQFQCAARLRALGSACLILDYEGVGESDGERSPENLRRDAHAAWDEAVRRADGDASRVIVRGTSIGTLAAACLLQDGERPAAVSMIAPVRAETVAPNFARPTYGAFLTELADWFVDDAVDVDLLEVLRDARAPVLVVVPWQDFLLGPEETELVKAATEEGGGVLIVRRNEHTPLALAGRDLLSAEVAFYERQLPHLFPDREREALERWQALCLAAGGDGWAGHPRETFDEGEPARARLATVLSGFVLPTPDLALTVVLAGVTDDELHDVSDWLAWQPPEVWALDPEALLALVSLEDAAGRLEAGTLAHSTRTTNGAARQPIAGRMASYAALRRGEPGTRFSGVQVNFKGVIQAFDPGSVLGESLSMVRSWLIEKEGLCEADADRQVLRLFLKGWGVPERVRADGVVEIWEAGRWQPCPLPPDEPWQ